MQQNHTSKAKLQRADELIERLDLYLHVARQDLLGLPLSFIDSIVEAKDEATVQRLIVRHMRWITKRVALEIKRLHRRKQLAFRKN